MARPRKEDAGKARQALIDAFWELLEEIPYSDLSIRALSGRAGVNHNTFYRHFENIDDLAKKSFEQVLPSDVPLMFDRTINKEKIPPTAFFDEPEFQLYAKRVRLMLTSDSLYLNQIVENSLKNMWLSYLQIDESDMSEEERLAFVFLGGGFVTAMRANTGVVDSRFVERLFAVPFFRSAVKSLFQLGHGNQEA